MSKAALIQLGEDAKAFTHVRKFSSILWETNKKQKTQATNPPTPLNSPLPTTMELSSEDGIWLSSITAWGTTKAQLGLERNAKAHKRTVNATIKGLTAK